ncbi:hypothetical protein [Pseudomonas sp. RIT-PI-S]|uniref:hypothetical protein n=1 Tax=Pseudomonas sp. RIT-PI-S TaxID=3035295 RepID=UPI0021D8134A|nr:hypothetical protein [Pseudomonas sp. RIT-PI-S]
MKIVCLGWGSLIWKPDGLPVASPWYADGPELPVEFCRVGDNGELATALCIDAAPVPVLWSWLTAPSVEEASMALKRREAIPAERHDGVGSLRVAEHTNGLVGRWARAKGIEAVIWTALPPRIDGIEGRVPRLGDALDYLASLTGDVREHARSYVEAVPPQIDTEYRRQIAARLGWAVAH